MLICFYKYIFLVLMTMKATRIKILVAIFTIKCSCAMILLERLTRLGKTPLLIVSACVSCIFKYHLDMSSGSLGIAFIMVNQVR